MAQNPPPYLGINGLYVQTDKHVDATLAEYNGNARPGQLVVDTANYALYVGNASGSLTQVGGGGSGGYGDSNVVSLLAAFGSNNITMTSGYVDAGNVFATGEITATGNLQGANIFTSGILSVGTRILTGDGNVANPSYSFSSDGAQDTGLYWIADGEFGIACNGQEVGNVTVGGISIRSNFTINGNGEIFVTNNNGHGGAGYAGIMSMTNSDSGAFNASKFLRIDSAGALEVVNSAYTDTILSLSDSGVLTSPVVMTGVTTVAALPLVAGMAGARSFVSDSTVTASGNFGAVVIGGGANFVPVYCDGTDWLIG
jgi:hypothetical protein